MPITLACDLPESGFPPGTPSARLTADVPLAPGLTTVTVSAPGLPPASIDLMVKSEVPTGTTLSPLAFPRGWTHRQCYEDWASHFGLPDAAKAYLTSFPVTLSRNGQLPAMRDLGIRPVVCFRVTLADAAALAASCKMLAAAFADAPGWVCFNQEPNNPKNLAAGSTAAAFIAVSRALAPVVRESCGWPVLFCPATGGSYQAVSTWYPGPEGCDGVAPDHYCGAGGSAKALPAFRKAAEICARDSLPAGVGWLECGIAAEAPSKATPALLRGMLDDAAGFFIDRKLSGEPCAPFLWWNGPLQAPTPSSPALNAIWPPGFAPANDWAAGLWQDAVARIRAA